MTNGGVLVVDSDCAIAPLAPPQCWRFLHAAGEVRVAANGSPEIALDVGAL